MSGLALLCPGQGSQHPGMLALALSDPAARDVVERASALACGGNLVELAEAGGPAAFTNATAQRLVSVTELATWVALRDRIPPPALVLGYSVGELAAYGCAGALEVEELVGLASARAEAMDAAGTASGGGLAGVRGLPLHAVEALAAELACEVAIVNGPDHAVVGGPLAALDALDRRARRAGATVHRLPVAIAAHTSILQGAVAPFANALAHSRLGDPAVPVLAGIDATPVRTRFDAIRALSTQVARRIEWAQCLAVARELGCGVFLELGPGTALARMAAELLPGVEARSVDGFRTVAGVARWVDAALRRA